MTGDLPDNGIRATDGRHDDPFNGQRPVDEVAVRMPLELIEAAPKIRAHNDARLSTENEAYEATLRALFTPQIEHIMARDDAGLLAHTVDKLISDVQLINAIRGTRT